MRDLPHATGRGDLLRDTLQSCVPSANMLGGKERKVRTFGWYDVVISEKLTPKYSDKVSEKRGKCT